jgi:flagellar capping protein FliD
MALSPEDLEQVGTYVKSHLPEWLPQNVLDLSERITRVETELVSQRELMREGFAGMEKRFEQIDKRFEDMQHNMDKRFEAMDKRFESLQHNMDRRFNATQWFMGTGFAAVVLVVTLLEYLS